MSIKRRTNNKRGRPKKSLTQILEDIVSAKRIRMSWTTYSRDSEGKEVIKKNGFGIDCNTSLKSNEDEGDFSKTGYVNIKHLMAGILANRACEGRGDVGTIMKVFERLDGKPTERIETTEYFEPIEIPDNAKVDESLKIYKENIGQ